MKPRICRIHIHKLNSSYIKNQTMSLLSRSIWFFLFAFVFLLFVDEIVYCNNFCTIFYYHINASFFLQVYVYSFFLWNVSKRMTFLIPNWLKFWNIETKKKLCYTSCNLQRSFLLPPFTYYFSYPILKYLRFYKLASSNNRYRSSW